MGIDFAHIHQNYGKSAYLQLLKYLPVGVGLECGKDLTEGSLRMWKWLVSKGVAEASHVPEDEVMADDGHYKGLQFRTTYQFEVTATPEPRPVNVEQQTQVEVNSEHAGRIARTLRGLRRK